MTSKNHYNIVTVWNQSTNYDDSVEKKGVECVQNPNQQSITTNL